MKVPKSIRETVIALGLVAFGLLALPALVFAVGQRIIGDYEQGMGGFYEAIGMAVASGRPFAWLLILSPLIVVQLLRVSLWLHRQRKPVK